MTKPDQELSPPPEADRGSSDSDELEVLAAPEDEGGDFLDEESVYAEIPDGDLEAAIADDELDADALEAEAEPGVLEAEMETVVFAEAEVEPPALSAADLVEPDGCALPLAGDDRDLEPFDGDTATKVLDLEPTVAETMAPPGETVVDLIEEDVVELQPETAPHQADTVTDLGDPEPGDLFAEDVVELQPETAPHPGDTVPDLGDSEPGDLFDHENRNLSDGSDENP